MPKLEPENKHIKLMFLEGDGIGPEIVKATSLVLQTVDNIFDLGIEFLSREIGLKALSSQGSTVPDIVLKDAKNVDGIIIGPTSTNEYPEITEGGLNPSATFRKLLDLYANLRPAKSFPGLPPRVGEKIDLVIVRENTEGFYSDRSMHIGNGEFMPTKDLALSVRKVSRFASERIARTAFELAIERKNKVTAVHKANVFRISDGLFLESLRNVRKEFPSVEYDEKIVDAMAALLIRDPSKFDVVVTTNMFGDILSDEASEIAGGLGLGGSLNSGDKYAMAQAQHGSAPDIASMNMANPASLIISAAMLLRWIGKRNERDDLVIAASSIERAISSMVSSSLTRTADLGGVLGTKEFSEGVVNNIKENTNMAN